MSPSALRAYALVAGAMYLTTHVTSIAAAAVFAPIVADPALAATAEGMTALRLGATLETVLAIAGIGTAVALLPVLRESVPALGYTFFGLRTLEGAVIAAGALPMLAATSATVATNTELTTALVALHTGAFLVGQGLVISINTLVIAAAIWRSRIVFPGIAVMGFVGGSLVLVSNVMQTFGVFTQGGMIAGILAIPVWMFELWFAGYLLLVGIRPRARRGAELQAA